jgi:hypothetical protein
MTSWAAYGQFEENRKGMIKPGFDANLSVLDKDILQCPEDNILESKLMAAVVLGEQVF